MNGKDKEISIDAGGCAPPVYAEAQAQGGGEVVCDCDATPENRYPHHDDCAVNRSAPLAYAEAQGGGEVRAWMRRWAFDGVDVMALPKNERPRGWQFWAVTVAKCLDDDVPLYTAPPSAPVGVEGLLEEWDAAYRAFKGAFATPLSRKRQGDEYAEDARSRLAAIDEKMRALAQQPAAEEQLTYKGVPIGPMQTFADMERQASAPVGVQAYNRKQIAWELERTAMGDGFYGNALRVAKDFPEATPEIRSLLDRWATGSQRGLSDRTDLCSFALAIALAQQPAADAEWIKHPQTVEAKAQWDAVAQALGADKDDPDAVLAAAQARQPAAVDGVMVERLALALTMYEQHRTTMQSLASSVGDFLRDYRALAAQPGDSDHG